MSTAITIAPSDLATRLRKQESDLNLLDVRRADEYEEWHIEGTRNIPIYDELLEEDFSGLAKALDAIPEDKENIIVCVAGITSARAAEFLRDRGYDAKSMEDGMRGWGRVHMAYPIRDTPGVVQIIRPGTGCISYLVHDDNEGVVIDPSLYLEEYLAIADSHAVDLIAVIDTHAHADHISGGRQLASHEAIPYYLHPADAGALPQDAYTPMEDGAEIPVGTAALEVMHTPGHTPGSVSLLWRNALIAGDTVFIRSVGRPDLEGNDEADIREASDTLFESLQQLAALPDETVLLPGHYSDEEIRPLATTLGELEHENELFGMDDRAAFTETIVESRSEEPANFNQIKAINWGKEPLTEDAADLELGPNNCAAN